MAFDAFLNALLRSSLTGDHILDYTSVEDCSLYDRVLYLKKLIADSYNRGDFRYADAVSRQDTARTSTTQSLVTGE